MKRGDRVLVTVQLWATVNSQTNEREPSGNWWVQIDGVIGLTAIHEDEITPTGDQDGSQCSG